MKTSLTRLVTILPNAADDDADRVYDIALDGKRLELVEKLTHSTLPLYRAILA